MVEQPGDPQDSKGGKEGKEFISEDRRKLNSFYTFHIGKDKFDQVRRNANRQIRRFALTGVVFGFFTEWLLGNGKIYSNIVKKSTMRRLSTPPLIRCQEAGGRASPRKGFQERLGG